MTEKELTWEDMRFIVKTADWMFIEGLNEIDKNGKIIRHKRPEWKRGEESFYKELLRRFNEHKK